MIIKSDGTPSYTSQWSYHPVMGITHVIRGEEHIPNTARQALLYRALGAESPSSFTLAPPWPRWQATQ